MAPCEIEMPFLWTIELAFGPYLFVSFRRNPRYVDHVRKAFQDLVWAFHGRYRRKAGGGK
jgi:hypothetical protein